jgi:hypothetical protein
MKNEALKMAAEFDKRFTSMNSIDVPEKVSVPRDEWRALHAAIKALAQPVQSAERGEPVWIQPDHLQKAQKAPFLCRVEPHKRDDFVPLYTTPPAAPVQEPVAIDPLPRACNLAGVDYQTYLKIKAYMPATPPAAQRPFVGLTEQEKQEWIDAMPYDIEPRHCMILVNVMEAKLKDKNNGSN